MHVCVCYYHVSLKTQKLLRETGLDFFLGIGSTITRKKGSTWKVTGARSLTKTINWIYSVPVIP